MNELERRIRQLLNQLSAGFSKWWSSSAARRSQLRHQASERATTAFNDLRDSETGKRAASTLNDLRQREPVRKAEESAKRALHDLRSGGRGTGGSVSS